MYTIKVADLLNEFYFDDKSLELIKKHSEIFLKLENEYNTAFGELFEIEYERFKRKYTSYMYYDSYMNYRYPPLELSLKRDGMNVLRNSRSINNVLSKYKALPSKAMVEVSEKDHDVLSSTTYILDKDVQKEVIKAKEYIAILKLKTLRRKEDGKG